MAYNAFPYRQTTEDQLSYAARINQQLSNDNDRLRQEVDRLRAQVFKYEKTGQTLVRDAEKFQVALKLRNEQYQMLKSRVAGLTRHLEKTRRDGSHWKKQVLELRKIATDVRNRIAPIRPVPRGARRVWPAVGDVVEVKNPYKEVPQHYYQVLAIGSPSYSRYMWGDGGSSPLKPNQYLVRSVDSLSKPDKELVDGVDWDLLYIGVEQETASETHNYISREKPLGE